MIKKFIKNRKFCNKSSLLDQRRGLSTIVGGVFMIIVIAGGINVTLWSLQQQERVTQSIIEKTDSKISALNENVEISDIRVDGNRFNITLSNSGNTVANITSIYFVNETASPKEQYRFDLNEQVGSRNSVPNIGQNLLFTPATDQTYTVTIITEAGNSVSQKITPLSTKPLPMSMYVIPPTMTTKTNVTLLFTVTNNSTEPNFKRMVIPTIQTPTCNPISALCTVTLKVAPPSSSTAIAQDSSALFKWVYYIEAPEDTTITFNATIAGASQGNYVKEQTLVKLIEASQTSFYAETTIVDSLVQKPEIFLIVPSPFGDSSGSSQRGLWGVVVANPTDQPMEIRKIVLTMYSPRGQTNDKIFIDSGVDQCSLSNITPSTDYWTCPATNMLMWEKSGTPLSIDGRAVQSFLVKVNPGSLAGSGQDLESYAINVSVFTSMGQFAKAGYSGTMRNGDGAVANVYMSNTVNSTSSTSIIGNVSGINELGWVVLNATIADFDNDNGNQIDSGTRLIIDIPKGFTDVEVLASGRFTGVTPVQYTDGSWQIIGTLSDNLTGESGYAARTIKFRATAPEVADTRIYLMYILADGTSDGNTFPVGPIAEVPLQVVPT